MDAIYECDLSAELHGRLSDWLLSIPEGGTSEGAFAVWATRNIKPDTSVPGKKDKENFGRLVEALGIEQQEGPAIGTGHRRVLDRRFAARAAAVIITVTIAVGAGLLLFDKEIEADVEFYEVAEIVLRAEDGECRGGEEFTLPDGSKVTLGDGAEAVYWSDFALDRNVRLDGEAFFEVVRDEAHPFSVNNGEMSVVVLGTEFKVEAYDDIPEAEVVLVSGSVEVEIGGERHRLSPKQKLRLDKSTRSVIERSEAGPGEIMRISGDDLCINNMLAADALHIVADYFGKSLVIEPGLLSNDYSFNGVLPYDVPLEKALEILAKLSGKAKFTIEGDAIHVSRK